jgi:hypothetical protein
LTCFYWFWNMFIPKFFVQLYPCFLAYVKVYLCIHSIVPFYILFFCQYWACWYYVVYCLIKFYYYYKLRTSLLIYTDDVNVLDGSKHTIKKDTEALVVTSKEIGLDVNVDRTKYMVTSWDQNAGQNLHKNLSNKYFEMVE